jgi:hypothetical protein
MSLLAAIEYECTRSTFRPANMAGVRWLNWDRDYDLARSMWPEVAPLSLADWYQTRQEQFTYCAVVEAQAIHAMAAVWKYCDTAWEVAAVSTKPAMRLRGHGKAVVSFVTAYILEAGKLATCSTAIDNIAMQRTAEAVGFCRRR